MNQEKAMGIIEGILFISGDPVSIDELRSLLKMTREQILNCIEQLQERYSKSYHGIMVSRVGDKLRLTTKPEIFPYIEIMFKPKVKSQLSKAALETLAIIMFKQPVTRIEIESIRGVNVEKALNTLKEKNLVCEAGRLNMPGRPILYATTEQCMEYFGLKHIEDISIKSLK